MLFVILRTDHRAIEATWNPPALWRARERRAQIDALFLATAKDFAEILATSAYVEEGSCSMVEWARRNGFGEYLSLDLVRLAASLRARPDLEERVTNRSVA